uniref:Homeobox domain-containing protein n=1 Tax=Scleropages formosus TaxID=113540 RepID=A0A8C9VF52_SCLFO
HASVLVAVCRPSLCLSPSVPFPPSSSTLMFSHYTLRQSGWRSRTIIQTEQLDVLYGCYFKDPNPGKHEFERISEWVHLPKKVVQIWFQNMRARERAFPHHSAPRRPRTHLTSLQVSIMQSCYETCPHPNALECETVGTELGLPLKVVQIWFQNTRAKEKRWRLQMKVWTCNSCPINLLILI